MSLFTANRTHPIDALIDVFVLLLPFFILFPSFTAQASNVLILGLAKGWSERFQHTNVRTNLGPLRWFLVTPQSHRVHHSTEPEHWNSNYASFFAWDRLFGTQHADVTSYPTTGINDPWFPEPERWSPVDFARSFVGQLLFPFDGAAVRRASTGSPHDPVEPVGAVGVGDQLRSPTG
jgi:sterol desaturase/sphingolipid hydroxylase (fatty acid hydroxylase superfamily)